MTPLEAKRNIMSAFSPEVRISVLALFALGTAFSTNLIPLLGAWSLVCTLVVVQGLDLKGVGRRLIPLNAFMLLLWLTLPFTAGNEALPLAHIPLSLHPAGVHRALMITIKANTILTGVLVLIGTMHTATLARALQSLRVPNKLVGVFVLTVRYLYVVRQEYERLRAAMRVRGFRPGTNRRTYRVYAYLMGMLFVRSLDRSERILAAMKCRGFTGSIPLMATGTTGGIRKKDVWFALVCTLFVSLLFVNGIPG